jgi:hypothetical protein
VAVLQGLGEHGQGSCSPTWPQQGRGGTGRSADTHLCDIDDRLEGVPTRFAILELKHVEQLGLPVEHEFGQVRYDPRPVGDGDSGAVALCPVGQRERPHPGRRACCGAPHPGSRPPRASRPGSARPGRSPPRDDPAAKEFLADPRTEQTHFYSGCRAVHRSHRFHFAAPWPLRQGTKVPTVAKELVITRVNCATCEDGSRPSGPRRHHFVGGDRPPTSVPPPVAQTPEARVTVWAAPLAI